MRKLAVVLLLVGCGGQTTNSYVTITGDAAVEDAASVSPDATAPADLAWTDLAGGVDIAQAVDMSQPDLAAAPDMSQPRDMAQLAPDLACPIVPTCNAPTDCCNGAASCINHYCQNLPGQPCNLDSSKGLVVTCYNGLSMGGPSGTCGGAGVCLP